MSDLFDDADVPSKSKQDVIIDDNGTFIAFPCWVYEFYGKELGAIGIAVYLGLKSHANRKRGNTTFVAVRSIAEELNIGESTARREISKLCKLELVARSYQTGKPTIYKILSPPKNRPLYHIEGSDSTPLPYSGTPLPYSGTPLPDANITRCINQMKLTRPIEESSTLLESEGDEHPEEKRVLGEIWDYYKEKIHKPLSTFSKKRLSMGRKCYRHALQRTKSATTAREWMEIAIDELASSDFHNARGAYKGQTKYNDWEYAFRSIEQFEKWLNRSNGE